MEHRVGQHLHRQVGDLRHAHLLTLVDVRRARQREHQHRGPPGAGQPEVEIARVDPGGTTGVPGDRPWHVVVVEHPSDRGSGRRDGGQAAADHVVQRLVVPVRAQELEEEALMQLVGSLVERELLRVQHTDLADENPLPPGPVAVLLGDRSPAAPHVVHLGLVPGMGVDRVAGELVVVGVLVVGQPVALVQPVRDVDPQAVHAAVEPEPEHLLEVRRDVRVAPVEVGLLGRERVQVPLAGGAVRFHDPPPGRPVEVLEAAVVGVDRAVIGDVVAVVVMRRRVEGVEPEPVDTEAAQVRQLGADTAQVADTVAVRVVEAAHVDLVDHGVPPPARRTARGGEAVRRAGGRFGGHGYLGRGSGMRCYRSQSRVDAPAEASGRIRRSVRMWWSVCGLDGPVVSVGRCPPAKSHRPRCSVTQLATCAREAKPSLLRMCSTWVSAVRCEITSLAAISLLLNPSPMSSAISYSRRVRPPAGPGLGTAAGSAVSASMPSPRASATAWSNVYAAPSSKAFSNAVSPSASRTRCLDCSSNWLYGVVSSTCAPLDRQTARDAPSSRAAYSFGAAELAHQDSAWTLKPIPVRSFSGSQSRMASRRDRAGSSYSPRSRHWTMPTPHNP